LARTVRGRRRRSPASRRWLRRSGFLGLPAWTTRLVGLVALAVVIGLGATSGLSSCSALSEPSTAAPHKTVAPHKSAPHRSAPHKSTPATSAPAPAPKLTAAQAAAALDALRVAGRGPLTGYDRDRYGPAWSDNVSVPGGHNGCDTRNDLLRATLVAPTLKPGTHNCIVLTGTLQDPYTGHSIAFDRTRNASAVQIDHIVPLGETWRSGASRWTPDQRRNLANDPAELAPVDGKANSAKGDSGPDSWRPPNRGSWCWYATTYISVKSRYHLSTQASEKAALRDMLRYCR
jgi:hypothetical protein